VVLFSLMRIALAPCLKNLIAVATLPLILINGIGHWIVMMDWMSQSPFVLVGDVNEVNEFVII
jgi:hypothetical protein